MTLQPIQFGAQCYQSVSPAISAERLINLYLEKNPENAKAPVSLIGTPGLALHATLPNGGPIRGLHTFAGGMVFAVSGESLYVVRNDGTYDLIGAIEGWGMCLMIDNGIHVGIVSNSKAYAANLSGITTLEIGDINGVAAIDGYGIFTQKGSETFWLAGPDVLTTVSGTDFSSADTFPDALKGCIVQGRTLWLFGENTIEHWHNAGDASFPFLRSQAGYIERGCAGGTTIAKGAGRVFWLGDDLAVYAESGANPDPVPISTSSIESLIRAQNDPYNPPCFCYRQAGRTFYVMCYDHATLCYDTKTGLWHERKSQGHDRWLGNCYAKAWGKHYVGDYQSGNIYRMDTAVYTDNGAEITASAVSPPLHNDGKRLGVPKLIVDMQAGVGLTSGQGSNPQLMLDWSDDGGVTWSNEVWAPFGKIGERKARAQFNSLGGAYNRAFRMSISDPVKRVIVAAYADLRGYAR